MLDSRYLSDSMPFPISVSGVVTVRVVTVEAALDQLERALALQKASALQRQGNEVHFRGGAFRWVSNWNVLVPISKGVLHVQPRDDGVSIFYRVTFSEMLIAVTVMMAVFVGPVVAFSSRVPVPGRIGVILIGWSWLFGGNFALAWWRLPRFLRRSLQPKRASD